jgi:hypothetical protein
MVIKYHISPFPSLLEDMIVRVWEAASDGPGAHVYEQTLPQPHSSPVTITINGLDSVVHIVRLYSAVSASLLHEYNVEPLADIVVVYDPIRFKINDGGTYTPVAGTDTFTHPDLALFTDAETDFIFHRNGYGQLFPDVHFTFNPIAMSIVLNSPDTFNDEEEFTLQPLPRPLKTPVNDSVVGKWFGGFVDVSANTAYSATHLRKLIRFSGSPNYTFGALDVVPIGYGFVFQNFGTSAGTAKIVFNNGPLKWGSITKPDLDLPRYSEACLIWDGTEWNVAYISDSSFINAGSVQPLTIIGAGEIVIGNLPAGDPVYTVTHNLNVAGNYTVFLNVRLTNSALFTASNRITYCWEHHSTDQPNKFIVYPQELAAEVQSVNINWIIVKLP